MRTLSQAAGRLGLSPDTLRRQVQRGRLWATLVGKTYVTTEPELARYRAASLGRRGRPAGMAQGFEALAFKAHLTGGEPPCPTCEPYRDRLFSSRDLQAPDLPIAGCTKPSGCTCAYK
jgi:hypothetical protein